MGNRVREGFQFLVGRLQFRGALDDPLFELSVELATFLAGPLAFRDVAQKARKGRRIL